ncbi:MAG: class II aldolase [Alphaproteobacteria bacterium]|nr:class II aldolase [Alphaproteobacteria bacterium]
MHARHSELDEAERRVRVDLAALYRLVALEGWDDMIFTHISARVPGPDHHFLLNPYGLMFEEITASSLVKVDLEGRPVDDPNAIVNPAGFVIHSAVHMARDDAQCVMHLHTDDGAAVSARAEGLLPITQHAMMVRGALAYHDYEGVALDLDERERLVADLGDKHCMLLRNHGTLAVGPSCAGAWLVMYFLERACTMQIRAQAGGDNLSIPNQGVPEKVHEQSVSLFDGRAGQFTWPTLLRKLDRIDPSYRN